MNETSLQRAAIASDRLPALFRASPMAAGASGSSSPSISAIPTPGEPYFKAVEGFAAWCDEKGLGELSGVTPMLVAAYVEQLGRTHSKPTVKQHLAAIRMLFDWLVTGHNMESNPAHAVRGPKHSVRKGKTSRTLGRGDARTPGRDRHHFPARAP